MSINIRNNANLEVSTPYFFRNVPIANRKAFGGWNYIAFSEEHFFKTTDLSDSQADRVKIVTGDSRFDIEEGAKSIERVGVPLLPSTEIRYSNNIPSTSLSGFLTASTILSSSVTKRMRDKLSKSGVGLTSGSKIVQMNGTDTSNLGVGMYVQGNGIQNGTKIQSITSTTITLDQNATSTFTTTLKFPVGTLKLLSSHRFNVGDLIQLSEVGTNWDGYYTVVDDAPAGDAAAVRFAWDYDPDSDVPLQDASGTVSYNLTNLVSNKQMTNNIATLTISGNNRFIAGDNVNISISDSWFNGIRNITSKTSSTISFNTEISNWIATTGTASGWTRPSYIDLAANGINNIVYPELPQVYSVTISPTTGLAVGTTLTATESVNSAYRYRSDTITYQWYRSSSLGNQGTLIASGKTYQLTNSDLNQYITAVVTGSNPKGSSTASSAQLLFAGPLPAPTGLSASSITATSATLSWNGVSGASSYEYAWGTSPNPTTWSSSGITSSNNVFSVSISGMVSNTTYYFRVRGKKNSTDVDGTISSINFNTRFAAPTVSASRNLASNSYTGLVGDTATPTEVDEFGRILINTTEPAGGRAATPQFYKIQSFYTSWADVGVFTYSNSTTTGVNFTTNPYLIPRASLITGGREYQFRVAICDSSGNTLLSDWSSSTPNVRPFNPPSAPELISIETGANATQGIFLTINWNSNIASDEPVYGWAVTRLSDEGGIPPQDTRNWVHYIDSAGPTKATQNNHTFENLSANTSYTLRVKALVGYTSSGSSSNLNVVNAFSTNILQGTKTTATTPGQPTSLSASPNKSGSYPNGIPTINVSWAPPTNNGGDAIESYLYRIGTANPPTGATWFSTGNSNTTLTISTNSAGNNLQLNTLYYIQIRSTNGVGSSAEDTAPVISARTWNVPSPPSTLSYSNATATGVTISWTTPSNNGGTPIIGYGLQRNQSPTEGPSYSAPPDASVPPWLAGWDSSLSGTWFWFRVKSYNDLGISTSFAVINPPTVPSQPSAPINVRTNSTTNTVSWTAPSSNGGGAMTYDVFRSQNLSTWTFQKNVSTTSTTVAATAGTTYYFAIVAKNSIGSSIRSPNSIRA